MHRVVGAYRERLQQRHAHQPERAALKALTVAVDALTATLETRVAALKRTDAATLACAESLWLRGDRLAVEMASNGKSDDVEEMKELLERARRFWPGEFREQKIALVNNIVLAIALAEERFGVGEIARFIEEMVSENVVQVEDVRDVESAQMVFFMYGICLLENDDVSKCRMFVNDLDDCLELNRNLPLLSLLYVLVMYFSREYDMARSLIRSLHFSNAMTFRYLKAFLLFEGKEFEESIKIILEEGDSPKYLAFQDFTLLSAAYSSTGSIEKATQSLQESIRKSITSKTIQGAYNTGTHAFLNGRWEQCITAYSIVLKNVEQMSSGLDIRHGVGKRFALEHSLENSNDCVDAATIYRCLSIAYYNAGKITLSLDHLRLMDEQLGIESSSLLCFYLEVSIQSKEYQLALGLCERILHLNPSCLEVAMDKAHVLFNLKDIKGCLEQCRLAIKSIETGRIREITQTNLESDPVAENLQEPSPKKSKTETLRDEMINEMRNLEALCAIYLGKEEDAYQILRSIYYGNLDLTYNLSLLLWRMNQKNKACLLWLRHRGLPISNASLYYEKECESRKKLLREESLNQVSPESVVTSDEQLDRSKQLSLDIRCLTHWSQESRAQSSQFRSQLQSLDSLFLHK